MLYHATCAGPAVEILHDGLQMSWDDVDHDRNTHWFISTTTDPNLWWAGGSRDTANVTLVLYKPKDLELEAVDRWDEVRIIMAVREDDPTGMARGPVYPINRNTVKEIWIKRKNAANGDMKHLPEVEKLSRQLGIPVVDKTD